MAQGLTSIAITLFLELRISFCSLTEGTCLLRPFELFPFEPLTLRALSWIGGFLTFHGVIGANFLMPFAVIFTAAFSSYKGLICRAHCRLCVGVGEMSKELHYTKYPVSHKHTLPELFSSTFESLVQMGYAFTFFPNQSI